MAILPYLHARFLLPTNPRPDIMSYNLIARLIILTSQIIPGFDLRFNQNRPANVLERSLIYMFDFLSFLRLGYYFLFTDTFRDRVYYLYEHPDHDDPDCLYPLLAWRHPYTTKWVIHSFPKVKNFWRSCMRFSRALKSLVPTFKSSPSFFGISPKLAVVIHGAGEWAEGLKIPNGCVIDLLPAYLSFTYFLSRPLLLHIKYSPSQHTGS